MFMMGLQPVPRPTSRGRESRREVLRAGRTWPRQRWGMLDLAELSLYSIGTFGAAAHAPAGLPPVRALSPGTLVTDRGADVPVSEVLGLPRPAEDLRAAEEKEVRGRELWGRVIRVAPADWFYNCHGWVFAGGGC